MEKEDANTEAVIEPEEIDTREFKQLEICLLDGTKSSLKLFETQAEFKVKERPAEKNILGKSIELLKLEIDNEKIAQTVNSGAIIIIMA